MLVLSRHEGEGITIGPECRIVVLGIKDGHVRLGIEAPSNVAVHRDEVQARIQEQNRLAADSMIIPVEAFRHMRSKR